MTYQIKVQGHVGSSWSDWFNEMEITTDTGSGANCITTLTGHITDQASLRGILNHLWDLNLTILSVTRIEAEG